jgi:hypothetical protein
MKGGSMSHHRSLHANGNEDWPIVKDIQCRLPIPLSPEMNDQFGECAGESQQVTNGPN